MSRNLARAIRPRLKVLALCLRDMVKLISIRAEDVRRAQNVRQVVVESQIIVDDAVVDMVRFQQVFQRPRPLLWLGLDLVCFDLGQLDAAGAAGPATEIGERRPSDLKHGVLCSAEVLRRIATLSLSSSGGEALARNVIA